MPQQETPPEQPANAGRNPDASPKEQPWIGATAPTESGAMASTAAVPPTTAVPLSVEPATMQAAPPDPSSIEPAQSPSPTEPSPLLQRLEKLMDAISTDLAGIDSRLSSMGTPRPASEDPSVPRGDHPV